MRRFFKTLSRRTALMLVVAGFTAILALVSIVPQHFWVTRANGEMCVKCGAKKTHRKTATFGIVWVKSTDIRLTPLSQLRGQFITPCPHDWVFDFYNRNPLFGGGAVFADGFPSQEFPAGHGPDRLAAGIQALPDAAKKIAALEAIGNRTNLLRWMGVDALRSLADSSERNTGAFSSEQWWHANSNFFNICTNINEARAFAKQLDDSRDSTLTIGTEMTLYWLDRLGR